MLKVTDTEGNTIPVGYDWYLTNGEPQSWWNDKVGDPPVRVVPDIMGVVTARVP